jgi:hypothetical protein
MTIKTFSAIAIVTAALSSPVFAQDIDMQRTGPQKPIHALRHYRTTYNQVQTPAFVAPRGPAGTYFDNESFDHSRVGGHDPDFNPSGS